MTADRPILITNEVAKELVTVAEAVDSMRSVFLALGSGEAETGARYRFPIERGFMQWGPARWDAADRFGYKVWANSGSPLSGAWIHLYEASTGRLLAVIEAHHTSLCRTAAVSLVAAQTAIAPHGGPVEVAIFGTGRQARGQIEALARGYDVSAVRVYSRSAERREAFARELGEALSLNAAAADHGSDAVAGADIVVTATSSAVPVVHGAWLDGVRLILAMGANRIYERELDEEAVLRMKTIVVDDLGEAQTCCGDLLYVVEHGRLTWPSVVALGPVLRSGAPLEEPVLFESQGLSVTDVAIADFVYRKALASGLGFDTMQLT